MVLMKIVKTDPPAHLPAADEFAWRDTIVQGARTGALGDMLIVRSPRRYKRFSKEKERVCFLAGSGHFKWARGETPFGAGECFCIDGEGEYEINGACEFIVAPSDN